MSATDAPTVGFMCVGPGGGCGSIHLRIGEAAACRRRDPDSGRTVRAVWRISRGCKPSYRRLSPSEAADLTGVVP